MISELNQRRWKNFRRNRKAFFSSIVFLVLFILSLFAEFIANDRPLLVRYQGDYFFPIFKFYPEITFGGDLKTEALYSDIEVQCLIISGGNINCWDFPTELIADIKRSNIKNLNPGKIIWAPVRYKYDTISDTNKPVPSPPDGQHFLGTDDTARDVFARIIYGFRISVLFGILVTIFASFLGVIAGAVQGYFGGKIDLFTQRFIEIWNLSLIHI